MASKFNLLLILNLLIVQIDILILKYFIDAKEIIWYSLLSKIFFTVSLIYSLAYSSLWPYFSSLKIGEDIRHYNKVKKYIFYILSFSITIFIFVALTLFFLQDLFFNFFFETTVPKDFTYILVLFFLYHITILWVHGFGTVIQSSNINLHGFVNICFVQAFISIVLQIIFTNFYGIYGPVIAMTLSFFLTMAWFLPYNFMKMSPVRGN
jgi:O-antigen/teichoic acid export membrane protein